MNFEKLKQLEQAINRSHGNMTGIVIQKDGQVQYENYYHGYTAHQPLHIYSVTKSVFSALIGVALQQGHIQSIHQKVLEFFPEYQAPDGEKTIQNITIRDLLTMTAPYKYETEPYEAFFMSENWMKFALDLLGGERPIGDFLYSGIVGSHILSGILANATGRPIRDFAMEHLFSPLEIVVPCDLELRTKEEHIAVMTGRNTSGWAVDPQGINPAGWGLFLTPVDMAKIGQLYLNGGTWHGRRLIAPEWIAESTREQSRWPEMSLPYGYLWWVLNEREHAYAAMGDGGTVIYVNTKKQLVVSIAALFMPDAADRIELIQTHIHPLFED